MEVIKKRLIWADVLRIIAIYLVIVVHTSSLSKSPFNLTIAWPFILSFAFAKTCVPLFVMLSGALLLGKTETYQVFFKKRVRKVLIPWIVWTLIYMFWNYNFNHYAASTISQWKYFFELTFLSQLWFLPLIFSLYLITPLLRLMTIKFKTADSRYLLLLWFIWVSALPFLHPSPAFPGGSAAGLLALAVYYSGYFYLGFVLTKSKFAEEKIMFSVGVTAIGIVTTLIEIFLIKNITLYPSVVFDYFAPGIVITSIGLFLLISHLFTKTISIKSNKLNSVIILLSSASLGIYIVHSLFLQIFDVYLQKYFLVNFVALPILEIYLHALIIFILSFGFVYLLKKLPLIRQIVP
jgi:surface polysaccharide O-acyltransferase-like enzyme